MLGELAASLAHEVKQPIAATVINANTGLRWLKHEQPDLDEIRHAAERIVQDGRRASGEVSGRVGGEAVGSVFTPPFPQPWLGRRHVAVLNS
jgi:hypothetical protein